MAVGLAAEDKAENVAPDLTFIRDVIRLGGKSAKKCFQCGTCTAVCNVSYARRTDESYPRKLMLWTQWGLRDRVLRDPGIWACHQCNDCSANCPRGAKPGDVLAALRMLAIERFSVPSSMARIYRTPTLLPVALGVPALVLVALVYLFQGMVFPTGEVVYSRFIPDRYIEIAGAIVFGSAILVSGLGLLNFWRELRMVPMKTPAKIAGGSVDSLVVAHRPASLESSFASTLVEVVRHDDFRSCVTDRTRTFGHMGLLFGAPFLLFATAVAALYSFVGGEGALPLTDPVKITGNLGALLILGGVVILGYHRLKARPDAWGAATYVDWLFLWIIFLNILTGIAVQVARFSGVAALAYPLYLVHLSIVFATFVYAPYGKFAHSFYRLAALTFLRHGGKAGLHKLYVLLPAALAVGVGVVAALVGLAIGFVWMVQAIPTGLAGLPPIGLAPLNVYLPIANVSISLPVLVGIGFTVGVLSGMTGVGGGFLMTPLLMTIGIPASPAVGTDNTQIAGTASSGALAHWRLGNVDVKLGLTILTGSLVGGTIGVQIVAILRAIGNFDFWVRIIYVVVLATVGGLMLRESVDTWIRSIRIKLISGLIQEGYEELLPKLSRPETKRELPFSQLATGWPLQTEFKKAKVRSSVLFPFSLGLTVGLLAAIMGVGGGFIMVPSMIYILGVPTHVAVGTDLFQMVFTAANVGFQQAVTNHNVDLVLAILIMLGAAVGAQVGARVGHRLEGHQLRTFLGVVVMLVMAKMLLDIVLPPGSLIGFSSSGGGH